MQLPSNSDADQPVAALAIEFNDDDTWAVWPNTALFDEVNQLEDSEQEQLRLILESAKRGAGQ